MARLKVRFVLNRGRHGAPLSKLGRIAEQTEKFLRSLASDCHVSTNPGEWLGVNFRNGSVEYDAEFQRDVNAGDAQVFARNLEFLADYDSASDGLNGSISNATALEFARIGSLIDPDEVIGLGIFPVHGGSLKWRNITYSQTANLRREIETPLPAHGALQGILHAWFKEAREPNFQIRDLSNDNLIKISYPSSLYSQVAQAVQERTTVLIVSGLINFNRATRQPLDMVAERIERQRMLSAAEFERLVGSEPNFVADMTEFEHDHEVT
ncbi:hypothetical protein [Roseococcus sp. YIM B11640]|uniref:hypothetical protein n=1 Tax=Roseococcus sp. YIM B11640 TaxID=3133973 RepID=UPI003C7D05D3